MKGKDFFLDINGRKEWLFNNFINTKNTHGSGCTLSAAICGYKALGFDLFDSCLLYTSPSPRDFG